MVIKLNHFDTKTKQDTGIQEKLENTLASYLFPGVKFSIGTAYPEATVPQDLKEHDGMTLQFSATNTALPAVMRYTKYKNVIFL